MLPSGIKMNKKLFMFSMYLSSSGGDKAETQIKIQSQRL